MTMMMKEMRGKGRRGSRWHESHRPPPRASESKHKKKNSKGRLEASSFPEVKVLSDHPDYVPPDENDQDVEVTSKKRLSRTRAKTKRKDESREFSGAKLEEVAKDTFLMLQRQKMYRYLIFRITAYEPRMALLVGTGDQGKSYDHLMASLPEKDCRYVVYDFDYSVDDNCKKSKIFFITWSPLACSIRRRKLYSANKDQIKSAVNGINYEIEANHLCDLDMEVLRERALGGRKLKFHQS